MKRLKLTFEALPSATGGENVRTLLPDSWDLLRNHCYKKAGFKCEICGGVGPKWPVEAHEVWEFVFRKSRRKGVQKLVAIKALCPLCHQCKHIGRTAKVGDLKKVREHHLKVNGITIREQEYHMQKVMDAYWERDDFEFEVNIDYARKLILDLQGELEDLRSIHIIG